MAANIVLTVLAIIAVYTAVKLHGILAIAWDSKLSRVPNAHWSVPYTKLWLIWQKGYGREFTARNVAHERFGPIVRVAPNDVSVNCIEGGIKTGWGNWDKAGWYAGFQYFGHHPLFSTVEAKPHAARKKMLASVYSKTFVDSCPELVEIMRIVNEDRLLPLLRERSAKGVALNVLLLSGSYFMDAITAYLYGLHNSTNFVQKEDEGRRYLEAFELALGLGTFWIAEFPRITDLLAKVGVNLVSSKVYECFPIYENFGLGLGETTRKSLATDKHQGPASEPIVFKHFWEKLLKAGTAEQDAANLVSAEMLDHLQAAHEASGILVTYLCYELSRQPAVQDRLVEELGEFKAAGKDPKSSPLLADILLETMRLHSPANGPFPRVSPPGGGRLGGFEIPGGVEVSASPYTLGRHAQTFPDPEKWAPTRWSCATPEDRKEMLQWVWVFGTGARACIGRYFAELTMKSMIVTIYTDFRTELAKPDHTNMEPEQAMMALPKGHELLLNFLPL